MRVIDKWVRFADQYVFLFIILGFSLLFFFFNADILIGAMELRSIYIPIGGALATYILFLARLIVWEVKITSKFNLLRGGIAIILGLIASEFIAFFGWLVALYFLLIGVYTKSNLTFETLSLLFAIPIFLSGLIALLGTKFNHNQRIRKAAVVCLLLGISAYIVCWSGVTRSVRAIIPVKIQFNNKHYFVELEEKWANFSGDYLTFYQCDTLALNCRKVYEATGYWFGIEGAPKTEFLVDPAKNTISIRVNDQVIYTYSA